MSWLEGLIQLTYSLFGFIYLIIEFNHYVNMKLAFVQISNLTLQEDTDGVKPNTIEVRGFRPPIKKNT